MKPNLNRMRAWLGVVLVGLWVAPLGQAQVQVTDNVVAVY